MRTLFFIVILFILSGASGNAQGNISDFLIMQDIGKYKFFEGWLFHGGLVGAPRVTEQGNSSEGFYTLYTVGYDGGKGNASPDVEIQVHQNTQWLEHKLQREFRETLEDEKLGQRGSSSIIKKFGNSRVLNAAWGGGVYVWLHNNLVVQIQYRDPKYVEPEPLEVIEAYLQKWPPTYPTEETKLIAGTEQWIKDEMEYLLWVSDRWFVQYDAGKEALKHATWNIKDSLDDFLRYRAKYFDENLDEERIAVKNADEPTLRTKLKEYQQWLAENKDKALVGL